MRLEDINLQNPVDIGYYDPFDAFPCIKEDVNSRFPLSNLHWKYHPQQPVRSIPILPTKLIEEVPQSRRNSLNEQDVSKIYLRLMFMKAEDVDVYRLQTRPLIIEWLKNSVKDKDISWAIVMVVPDGNKASKSSLMRTSIFDKLHRDFGVEGKQLSRFNIKENGASSQGGNVQRIVKLCETYDDSLQKLEEYNEFCTTLKSLLLETFDLRYKKSSKFIDALMPQANNKVEARIKIFLEKLKMSQALNDMRCFSESLKLCEELSAELKALLEEVPQAVKSDVSSVPFIGKLENFSIEESATKLDPCVQVSNLLYNGQSIEPFDIKLGLFLKLSNNLQSLANFASSISISSLYIADLLKELIVIINDGLKIFPHLDQFLQWLCAMCDFHLYLPLTAKLIELDTQQLEANNGVSNVMQILDYTGEIKLLKRFILDKMAVARGLTIPNSSGLGEASLMDIPLNDESKRDDKELEITYAPIASYFQSQKAYDESFERLSISAMQDFAKCERIKTVDLLSIDLAILHFKNRKYEEAYDIFLNCHEYFFRSGWNLMGGVFLEMYLECLLKLKPADSSKIIFLSLELFATLKDVKSRPNIINTYNLVKTFDQREQMFRRICQLAKSVGEDIEYSLEELFNFGINPYIDLDEALCKHFIELEITNQFGIEFQFSEVYVVLARQEHSSGSIKFSTRGAFIPSSAESSIRLYTNEFRSGAYILDEIGIKIAENITLRYKKGALVPSPDDTVVHVPQTGTIEFDNPPLERSNEVFHFYPSPKILRVEFEAPQKVDLGSNTLVVVIHNGSKNVEDLEVKIENPSYGLNVQNDLKTVQFQSIKANNINRHVVEFDIESKVVEIVASCTYKIGEESFVSHFEDHFDTNLLIFISVQDIFRSSTIYAKFQIGCVEATKPVRVTDCRFTCPNDKYEVKSLSLITDLHEPFLVSSDQLTFIFYKLIPKCDDLNQSDTLDLSITHSNLQNECEQLVKFVLQKKFLEHGFEKYVLIAYLIVPEMKFDLFQFGVEGRLRVNNKQDCKSAMHTTLSTHVAPELREQLLESFMAIFEGSTVKFPNEACDSVTKQVLQIPVAVPYLHMLHQVKFQIERNSLFVVGEPIMAKIIILSTSRWSLTNTDVVSGCSSSGGKTNKETRFEMSMVNEENWLISGVLCQGFSVVDGHSIKEIDVCLVPLNVGELHFPKIDIKSMDPACSLDVVHENASETVFVTPDIKSISVTF